MICHSDIKDFGAFLAAEEASPATIARYVSIVSDFCAFAGDRPLTKELLIAWRDSLRAAPSTVNVACAAVNRFMICLGREDLRLRYVKTQRRIFRDEERELSRAEYERLIETAERGGNERLARAIETIGATGIRVSELRYITVESLARREVTIYNKGKYRCILLTAALARKLRAYCRAGHIRRGPVFVTRTGRPLGRGQLWDEMKRLCAAAGVDPKKVFPHNLRHLFAVTFYRLHRDVVKLADILGHSSVDTTRIYLATSGREHRRELEELGLVLRGKRLKAG